VSESRSHEPKGLSSIRWTVRGRVKKCEQVAWYIVTRGGQICAAAQDTPSESSALAVSQRFAGYKLKEPCVQLASLGGEGDKEELTGLVVVYWLQAGPGRCSQSARL
jgi:hypothetical protein